MSVTMAPICVVTTNSVRTQWAGTAVHVRGDTGLRVLEDHAWVRTNVFGYCKLGAL